MYTASYTRHQLAFIKPAKTSRNVLTSHEVFYVKLKRKSDGKTTYGEAAPLKGLSIDNTAQMTEMLAYCCEAISNGVHPEALSLETFPSIRFALETAFLAMENEAPFMLFDTPFYKGIPIPINGLVWMNEKDTMLEEALMKAGAGFDTIKFKVGALDFDEECRMLESFRKRFDAFKVTIRLDANGAFKADEALFQLKELSRFNVHSIEQPVKAGMQEMMQEICAKSPIDVALDEELIGVNAETEGAQLIRYIKPKYLIIKPTLLGGLAHSSQWVKHARANGIDWWATSALESNIGLNAIAQWVSTYPIKLPQGLGTGSLYHNNISGPLRVSQGSLYYSTGDKWELKPVLDAHE